MKALCLVAHPDDCVIFGYSFMHHHSQLAWTVCYLTCTNDAFGLKRSQELQQFWTKRNINTLCLGFEDCWKDQELKELLTWPRSDAEAACWAMAQEFDLILTHDKHGDYGHIHHQLVHDSVKQHNNIVTFAQLDSGTDVYTIPNGVYSVDELPTHEQVIKSFHQLEHANSYTVPVHVKTLLKEII